MDDIEEYTTKVLKQEGVGDKFFVGGLSQGSQACTVVADRFGERVQGCLMMCPYMPFMKAYEMFHGGPIVSDYLTIHPMKTPVSAFKSVFPPNFVLWMLLHNILPIVKHSFCLFRGWLGFGQMRFAISPDMLAATCRLNCEGKTDINDAIFSDYKEVHNLICTEKQHCGLYSRKGIAVWENTCRDCYRYQQLSNTRYFMPI